MLKIYDVFGNQLGLIVGEYDKELLVWLGNHSIEYFDGHCVDFAKIELRCAKKLHITSVEQRKIEKELKVWWSKKFGEIGYQYHRAVLLFNISKKDWTGIDFLSKIPQGVFTLINYKYLEPNKRVSYDRSDFSPEIIKDGKYLSMIIEDHPHIVTYDKLKPWETIKKDSGVYTQLSLRCGEKILNKKLPYFVQGKKGDQLLLEITDHLVVPKVFVNGMKYSYMKG
ncbi:hypothetical protein HYG86_16635 [Alkalicella caledoniensis]|uniref:Uncharacterized protein n=1 Tax=Alkalicella caledoniensis TaxID=2731377 RepID=A0A7G9WC69_ALKCA|nr:hypothetical protein [Alkalicella caledoniensis]QNO16281.1 hypothetical protein HYG86_16635 [Alkalicella caledoniensis]